MQAEIDRLSEKPSAVEESDVKFQKFQRNKESFKILLYSGAFKIIA